MPSKRPFGFGGCLRMLIGYLLGRSLSGMSLRPELDLLSHVR
jgi:hypothetical protein